MSKMGIAEPFEGRKLLSVQSLRGIAALFVMLQHISFIARGSFGVDIFLVISGFIMVYTTQNPDRNKHFLLKRVIRIVPLYYGMTLISFGALLIAPGLFDNTKADPLYLVKSLLFIPFSIGEGEALVTQPLLRVGWTVNYEILFYLIFFLAMKLSHRYRAVLASVFLAALAGSGAVFPNLPEPFHFWTDSLVLCFVLGMGLYYLYKLLYGIKVPLVLAGIVVLILFVYLWMSYRLPSVCALPEIIRFGLPAGVITLLFLLAGDEVVLPKGLTHLGDMSFSIYMVHYYPMRLLSKVCEKMELGNWQYAMAIAGVVVTLAIAYVVYRLFEIHVTRVLKNKWLHS